LILPRLWRATPWRLCRRAAWLGALPLCLAPLRLGPLRLGSLRSGANPWGRRVLVLPRRHRNATAGTAAGTGGQSLSSSVQRAHGTALVIGTAPTRDSRDVHPRPEPGAKPNSSGAILGSGARDRVGHDHDGRCGWRPETEGGHLPRRSVYKRRSRSAALHHAATTTSERSGQPKSGIASTAAYTTRRRAARRAVQRSIARLQRRLSRPAPISTRPASDRAIEPPDAANDPPPAETPPGLSGSVAEIPLAASG